MDPVGIVSTSCRSRDPSFMIAPRLVRLRSEIGSMVHCSRGILTLFLGTIQRCMDRCCRD
jgi:hypothetical protein